MVASEPSLEMAVEGKQVTLTYANIAAATINIYTIDLEVLFSFNPFLSAGASKSLFVSPNYSEQVSRLLCLAYPVI